MLLYRFQYIISGGEGLSRHVCHSKLHPFKPPMMVRVGLKYFQYPLSTVAHWGNPLRTNISAVDVVPKHCGLWISTTDRSILLRIRCGQEKSAADFGYSLQTREVRCGLWIFAAYKRNPLRTREIRCGCARRKLAFCARV